MMTQSYQSGGVVSDSSVSIPMPQPESGDPEAVRDDQHEQILHQGHLNPVNHQKQRPVSFLHRPCLMIAKAITWLPVLFILSVVGWSYYAFVIQLNIYIIESVAEKVVLIILYHFVFVLFVWSYGQTIMAPSCTAPSSWKLSTAMLERLNAAKSEEDWKHFLELFVVEMELPVVQRSMQGAIRYCEKCQAIKPDRSHHCSVCNSCILKMDHHCPWVNNCVAFNNYKFFILFLGYALTYCLFLAASTLKYFILFWSDGLKGFGAGKFHVLFLFFVSIMFCISVSSLFWYHVYLIMYNRSTLEQFRAPYFNGSGPDTLGWSLGKANNFREVFGYNKWLWFVPVSTSVGDGLTYPTRIHYQGRNYQSTSDFDNGMTPGDECAVNMMGNSSEGIVNNGAAASTGDSQSSASVEPQPMTSVLEGNNRVTARIGRPNSSYSVQ